MLHQSYPLDHAAVVTQQPTLLKGIGTALPPHQMRQADVLAQARRLLAPQYPFFEKLVPAFENAGVDKRYSLMPLDWFDSDHGWADRGAAYLKGATDLFVSAATDALAAARVTADKVDTIVTISSTGIATPTLEAQAHKVMGFRTDVRRVPVFGLGCAGGVSGLSIARRLAAADPGSIVLMVAVEACSLSFRSDRLQKADVIATVLFGDGAAAAVIGSGADGSSAGDIVLHDGQEHLFPDTLPIMGWDVDDTGLGVIFDRSIPGFVADEFRPAVREMLNRSGLAVESIDRFVCHPGGTKVVEAIEETMGLQSGSLNAERDVLRDFGNMSAPTALFVLQRVLAAGQTGRLALCALGPGFTAAMMPITVAS